MTFLKIMTVVLIFVSSMFKMKIFVSGTVRISSTKYNSLLSFLYSL